MLPAKFSDFSAKMTDGDEPDNQIEMVEIKQKALTYQQPNERELKNEIRWIHCWNLWTELTRQRIRLSSAALGQEFDKDFRNELQTPGQDSKEYLLKELQALIVKKPLQTLSKLKTIRRIKEIGLRIDIWEKVRREGVVFLSFLQIQICSFKCGDSELTPLNYKLLESLKSSFVEKILCACKNIDYYYKELVEAIALFKTFRCHALFTDPTVAKWIDKSGRRNAEFQLDPVMSELQASSTAGNSHANAVNLPGGSGEAMPSKSRKNSCSSQKTNASSSALDNPDIPDFMEPLFASRKAPSARPASGNPPPKNMSTTREAIKYYVDILHQGTGWFFAWCQFTDAVLKEIKRYYPSLGSEVMNHMTKHINTQITLIKGILVQVCSLGEKIRRMTHKEEEMGSMMTCVSTLDDFVSLIESVKHEASYLIRYVEIELINLGVLDLNREPKKFYPLRLFRIRNIISMKDSHLLASVDYLYLEMGFLLEFIELQFCSEKSYVEKYGQLTADLFKKYTVNRREAIQEKENKNIEMMQDSELVKELPLMTNSSHHLPQPPAIYQSPISRYQRAEDLRKWVEDSMKMTPFPNADDDNNSLLSPPPPLQTGSDLEDYPDLKLGEEGGDGACKPIMEADQFREFLTSAAAKTTPSYYSPLSEQQTPPSPAFYIRNDPNLGFPTLQLHPNGRALGRADGKCKFFQHIKPQYVIQERPSSSFWKTSKSNANSLKKSMQKKFTKKR